MGSARDRRGAHRLRAGRPGRDVRRRDPPRAPRGGRRCPSRPGPLRRQRSAASRGRRARSRDRRCRSVLRRDARRRRRRSTPSTRRSRSPASTWSAARSAARSATCSAARSATGCRSAATSSTSGPATRRCPTTSGARHWIPTGSWPRQADGRRAGASARSSSRAGCSRPTQECAAIEALRAAFPDLPLRLDPNGAWTPETSVAVAERLSGVVEYLEDPTPGIEGMAYVAARTDVPLATNMCVIAFEHVAPAVAAGRRADRAVRPPPLGRAAALRAARRHHRDVRAGAVDAQQLPPRRLARRDGAPGRRDAEPDLRLRHPLPVEDPGRDRSRASCRSTTGRSPCQPVPASASSSTGTCSACCTSSTSAAAYAVARTPSTCGRSTRRSRPTRPGGERVLRTRAGGGCCRGARASRRAPSPASPARRPRRRCRARDGPARRARRRSGRTPRAAGCAAA